MPRHHLYIDVEHKGLKREFVYGYCDYTGNSYKPREFLIELQSHMDKELYTKTLIHELVHVHQWVSGSLKAKRGKMYYDKEPVDFYEYWDQPHEIEAREKEESLYHEYISEG